MVERRTPGVTALRPTGSQRALATQKRRGRSRIAEANLARAEALPCCSGPAAVRAGQRRKRGCRARVFMVGANLGQPEFRMCTCQGQFCRDPREVDGKMCAKSKGAAAPRIGLELAS